MKLFLTIFTLIHFQLGLVFAKTPERPGFQAVSLELARSYTKSETLKDFILNFNLPEKKQIELYGFYKNKNLLNSPVAKAEFKFEPERMIVDIEGGTRLEIKKDKDAVTFWLNQKNTRIVAGDSVETIYQKIEKVLNPKQASGFYYGLFIQPAHAQVVPALLAVGSVAAFIVANIALVEMMDRHSTIYILSDKVQGLMSPEEYLVDFLGVKSLECGKAGQQVVPQKMVTGSGDTHFKYGGSGESITSMKLDRAKNCEIHFENKTPVAYYKDKRVYKDDHSYKYGDRSISISFMDENDETPEEKEIDTCHRLTYMGIAPTNDSTYSMKLQNYHLLVLERACKDEKINAKISSYRAGIKKSEESRAKLIKKLHDILGLNHPRVNSTDSSSDKQPTAN